MFEIFGNSIMVIALAFALGGSIASMMLLKENNEINEEVYDF